MAVKLDSVVSKTANALTSASAYMGLITAIDLQFVLILSVRMIACVLLVSC